jgi:PAS domain S-box-containing protein
MGAPYNLFVILLCYLFILFILAYYAETKEKAGKSLINNPYVFSLSLAVYCTSWTFYGSVGRAATSGMSFLTIYLGPTLMAALWVIVLKKVVRIARANRITTISDFIGSRYGKSLSLATLVSVVAVVGIIPYIGLQIKAIMSSFAIMSGNTGGGAAMGFVITLILGIFSIIFGARRLDSSERHGGLVFAIAFESVVKLVAFVSVGAFVTFGLFDGFDDILRKISHSDYANLIAPNVPDDHFEWTALILLSMAAIMLLPRQFQMAVVENYDERHIEKAAWLFPLYLLLINIFVVPIALGGILREGAGKAADFFVLTVPLHHGSAALSLLAFIGGFSAATGMVIVEALALSTMVMHSLVMPFLISFEELEAQSYGSGVKAVILNIKRVVILGVVFLGYLFAISIGEFYSLVDIGLKSFEAVALFAPAFFLGLYWKGGTKAGAIAGLSAGFLIWCYTLIVPALMKAGYIERSGFLDELVSSHLLNPEALFGITGLGKWGHSFFWSLSLNLLLYFGVSAFTKQTKEEEVQSLVFVESFERVEALSLGKPYTVRDIEHILSQYLGQGEATAAVDEFLARRKKNRSELSARDLLELQTEAEKVLSGVVGSSMAAIVFKDKPVLTVDERGELSESLKHITQSLRLSRQELAGANRELSYLKEFSENIIESAPLGIVTVDASFGVNYWNKEMENFSGIARKEALGRPLRTILPWIPADLFSESNEREITVKTVPQQLVKINISPFKDPSGGFVVIFEDVTLKKQIEEQLLQTSKLASLGKLTAGISHEIGNPLASIFSLVQELRHPQVNAEGDREFTEECMNTIGLHVERIAKIVRSLGDFARISSSEKRLFPLAEIIDRTLSLVKYDRRFKEVSVALDLGDTPPLRVSPDQMQQVFLNLLLNALDAMPHGGRIEVSARKVDSAVEIAVRDTGCGVDESIVDRIFDPFFTTKPFGKGTGLGLSICYGIIRDHNGTIDVRSRRGEGTTFTIRVPTEA